MEDASKIRKRFRILMEIGRGGMATVFLAERISFGVRKLVVLKVLNGDLAAHSEMRSAFHREAHLSARMNHPNVVQVYEVVEHGGQTVIVMEFLDGLPLSKVLRHSELPLSLHIDILMQVLDGLHHFHELTDVDGTPLNAVHRDVSPQNVLVLHDGVAKVLDFGVAKFTAADADHTRTGLIKGKIQYMPPEQLLSGAEVDRRADIFALGVMLWQALAGRRLWQDRKEPDVMRALARGEIPRLRDAAANVHEELEAIVNRALEPDPEKRFATALEMKLALESAVPRTVGVTNSRALTAFMAEHFAEERRAQRAKIDGTRRESASEIALDAPGQGGGEIGADAAPLFTMSGQQALTAIVSPSQVPPPLPASPQARRRWPWLVLAAIGVCGAGIAAFRPKSAEPLPVREQTGARSVQLHVLADPETAEILLDGELLGKGRYEGTLKTSAKDRRLLVRAAGFAPKEEVLRLDNSEVRLVRLERLPPNAAPAEITLSPSRVSGVAAAGRSASASNASASRAAAPTAVDAGAPAVAEAPPVVAAAAPATPAEQAPASSPVAAASQAPASAASLAPAPAPSVATAVRPRQLAPMVGHSRLTVNVSADPYKVRIPPALFQVSQTLEGVVRICVNTSGGVSSVSVLRSSDPALDRQLLSTIPRWRYNPLLDEQQPVPFCYTTNLRFVSGR
ncbi:MAG: TonB family protein [Polyangiaceae bacterium]